MSTQAMSFSGVAPSPTPALDRSASAFYGERRSAITTPSRGLRPAHTANPLIVVHLSARGEAGWLDGAEGIDGAEI